MSRMKDHHEKSASINGPIRFKDLMKGPILKPFGITLGLMFFQQATGINAVVFWTVSIFQWAGSSIDSRYATIIVGAIHLLCCIGSGFLVDRFGRRVLLLGSAAITSISLAAMGVFFYFQRIWGEADATLHLGWLPLVSLMVFMAAYSCGLSNVPFIVMGELFPTRYRTFLGTISSSFNLIVTLIVVRFFPDMLTGLGKDVTFFVFTGCTLTCIVFVYFLLPETKGKTLEDMEQLFSNNVPKVKKIPEEEDEEAVPEVSTQLVTISDGQCGLVGHNILPTTEEIENDEVFATF